MASELQAPGLPVPAVAYYGRVFNSAFAVWNGSTFITDNSGNFAASTKVTITDAATLDWVGDAPAGSIAAGAMRFEIRDQAAGAPAFADLVVWEDFLLGSGGGSPLTNDWYYSGRAGVLTVVDAGTLAKVWDMDDDGAEDAGLLVSDGVTADGYIDLFLASEGIDVPVNLGTAPAHVVKALADVSNHMTVWNGWKHRGLQELSGKLNRSADDLSGIMSNYKAYADEQLEKIGMILAGIEGKIESTAGAITVAVADAKIYPGTGGIIIPAVSVSAPNSPLSY